MKTQNINSTTLILMFLISKFISINSSKLFERPMQVSEVDHYIYYFPEKEIVLCSSEIFSETKMNLIPNELKLDDKFTCMINIPERSDCYTKINLNIFNIKAKSLKNDLMDIYLGESLVLSDINPSNDINPNNRKFIHKDVIVKFSDGKVYYANNKNCNLKTLNQCNFIPAEDAIFRKKNLMMNIKLKDSLQKKKISLLETKSKFCFLAFN